MGGGKGGGINVDGGGPSPGENISTAISWDLYKDTSGIRHGIYRDLAKLLGVTDTSADKSAYASPEDMPKPGVSNFDLSSYPTYAPLFGLQKRSLESQYQQAKQQIMNNVAPGGNLSGALANLEYQRAGTMGALPAQLSTTITQDLMDKAYGLASGSPQTSLSGLSTATQAAAARQNAALGAAANQYAADTSTTNSALAGIGSGIGKGIGYGIGK